MSIRLGKKVIAGYVNSNSYVELSDKPKINNIELSETNSLEDLQIQPAGDYIQKSELCNTLSELNGLVVPDYSRVTNVRLPYTAEIGGILIFNITLDSETIVHIFVDENEIYVLNNFGLSICPMVLSISLKKDMTVTTKVDGKIRYYNYKFIPF